MLVQEMHIGLDVGVQKLNTDILDNIVPEQKDWVLNEAMLRFIKNRVNPKSNPKQEGFEHNVKRIEDLEDLYEQINLPVFIEDTEKQYAVLPSDYFLLIEGESSVVYNCNNVNKNIGSINELSCIVPFTDNSTATPFEGFRVTQLQGTIQTILFDINNYQFVSNVANGILNSVEEKFYIVHHVLEIINRNTNIEVYWEVYKNVYSPNSFIFITNDETNTGIEINVGGTIYSFNITALPVYTTTDKNIGKQPSRLVSTKVRHHLKHPFLTTRFDSPIFNLFNKQVKIYHNEKFILSKFHLSYIRKPRLISLSLGQSCEVNANFHEEIVDIAVQLIKSRIEAKDYRNIINENLLKE